MSIQKKIITNVAIISFIAVLITSLVITAISFHMIKSSAINNAEFMMSSFRESKKTQIYKYFDNIKRDLLSISSQPQVISELNNITKSFYEYSIETADITPKFRADALSRYQKSFDEIFAKKSGGESFNPINVIRNLDNNAFALQYKYIIDNPHSINQKYKFLSSDTSSYAQNHNALQRRFLEIAKITDAEDILFVSAKGDAVYTFSKNIDFATSLISGYFKNTPLFDVINKASKAPSGKIIFSDFAHYLPAFGQQIAFVGTPIFSEGKFIGTLVLSITTQDLSSILSDQRNWKNIGLGETGEVYLVGMDKLTRTESRFFIESKDTFLSKENTSSLNLSQNEVDKIIALNSTVGVLKLDTPAINLALNGNSGVIENKYGNYDVISAFEPITIFDQVKWALISEIDTDEAIKAAKRLLNINILVVSILSVLILCFVLLIGKKLFSSLSKSIQDFAEVVLWIAEKKDFTKRIRVTEDNELKTLSIAVNTMVDEMEKLVATSKQITKEIENQQKTNSNKVDSSLSDLSAKLKNLSDKFQSYEDDAGKQGW